MKRRIIGLLVVAALILLPVMVWGQASQTRFADAAGAVLAVPEYRVGELVDAANQVYVRVDETGDANYNGALEPQTLYVRFECPATGDYVDNVPVVETAAGLFDNALDPIVLVPYTTGIPNTTDERLEVNAGDVIRVYYVDPQNANDVSQDLATAIIGPVNLYEGGTAVYANLRGAFVEINAGPTTAIGAAAGLANPLIEVDENYTAAGDTYPIVLNVEHLTLRATGLATQTILDAGGAGVNILNITADNVTVEGFTIRNTGGVAFDGINVAAAQTGITLRNNIIDNATANGINLAGGGANPTIEGNTITDAAAVGINFGAAVTGGDVRGNTIGPTNVGGNGINFAGTVDPDTVVAENTITNVGGIGINFAGNADGSTTTANEIVDSTNAGVEYGGSANQVALVNNRISNTGAGGDGVNFTGAANFAVVDGNTIEDAGRHGIRFADVANDTFVNDNTIRRATNAGLLFAVTVTRVAITNNVITDCVEQGMLFNGAVLYENLSILGNVVTYINDNDDSWGILFEGPGGVPVATGFLHVNINNNTIANNSNGIGIQLTAGNNMQFLMLDGNVIRDNGFADGVNDNQFGLQLLADGALGQAQDIEILNSAMHGNEIALDIDNAGGNVHNVNVTHNTFSENDTGVAVGDENNTINFNDFVDNASGGYAVDGRNIGGPLTVKVNAENNWWGDASGPFHLTNPTGQGDAVTNYVDFSPWGTSLYNQYNVTLNDATIPCDAVGLMDLSTNCDLVVDLQIGNNGGGTEIRIDNPGAIDFLDIVGVDPYEVVSQTASETATYIAIKVAIQLKPGGISRSGVLAQIYLKGTGAQGDTCTATFTNASVDVLRDELGDDIAHTTVGGTVTLGAAGAGATGDVNGDGMVDITDARWVAEYAIGIRAFTAAQKATADVAPPHIPPDTNIDITDARWIAEAAIGLRTLSVMAMHVASTALLSTAQVAINESGQLVISGSTAELADIQGTLCYDPTVVNVTDIVGLNGFTVLASAIDNAKGEVRFAAANLAGRMMIEGALLQFICSGNTSQAIIDVDVLRDVHARDVPVASTAPVGNIEFGNSPNPITDVHTTTFEVKGLMAALVETIKVQIFDLSGRLVYESEEIAGTSLDWHTDNNYGEYLSNGVYLYKLYALINDQWVISETKKLVILR